MSRHEGVSCDSCLKNNFRGRRYKCLICYDYDLCAACYETGASPPQHTADHPMQCILTRTDFELYYGGEALGLEQPQAYTCPFCNRMGFTDTSLQEHVTAEHAETTAEVVCPVCAAMPGGEPNLVTDDFIGHLTDHRPGPRDLISFLDEPSGIRHGGVRRIPHSGRGVGRSRRSNMHFSGSGGLSSLSPSSRDAVVDPIAELLSQLSGVRRSAAGGAPGAAGTPNQLQQLQMQLQLERQQVTRNYEFVRQAARQQLERMPRRAGAALAATSGAPPAVTAAPAAAPVPATDVSAPQNSQFLLTRYLAGTSTEEEAAAAAAARAERATLLRGLVLASLGPPAPPPPPPPAPRARALPALAAAPPPRACTKPRKEQPMRQSKGEGRAGAEGR